MTALYGGIEAGGSKFVCAVGTAPDDLRAVARFPTTTPAETIGRALVFFREQARKEPLTAVGISSFGPVDPNPHSATFGYITSTPKRGWANTDFAKTIESALGVPVGFDTDVNGAALAEYRWGAAQGMQSFVYLTVGTGIGGGALVSGKLIHGLIHPEMGHMRVPHDRQADPFAGACPFHGDCLEGLASGPAIEQRWGQPPETLSTYHPAWNLESRYLGLAIADLVCILSPQCVLMGGGVMDQPKLFPLIRHEVQTLLNGYVQAPRILESIDQYIVPPKLGKQAGVLGAIALAQQRIESEHGAG